jgi:hypothetical protein
MSQETPSNDTKPQAKEETPQTGHTALLSQIDAAIKGSASKVFDLTVKQLAETEINSRVDKLVLALAKRDLMKKEFAKMKPDQVSHGLDGAKTETWSKDAYSKMTQAKSQLESLGKAIDAALANEPEAFKKLDDMVKLK